MTYDAILPAGGRIDPDFAKVVGTDAKALIRFGEETILERTLRAIDETGKVRRKVVIGGAQVQAAVKATESTYVLPEARSGPENILNGLKHLLSQPDAPHKVLVVTTDLPLLTGEILNRYIAQCPTDRDITVPLITKEAWTAEFPNSSATFATLKDGAVTTGCAYLIDVVALQKSMPQIERVFENRKSVVGMAKLLGPKFLFKFLAKTLSVEDVETKIQAMLGCSGAAIRNAPPELAYDIDALDDYEYLKSRIS